MRSPLFQFPPRTNQGPRGVALIITLAILAILTTLLVSFVSMASMDRGATKSYSQALGADQVALGGLDQIVSQLQAEIADPQLSTNVPPAQSGVSNNLYLPLADGNAGPQRTAPNLPGLATLLSYSGTNLYTGSTQATNYSSPSSTENPSLNGRSISTNRWAKPQFTTNSAGFPAPQWILVTRSGPQAFTSYNSALADGTITNNSYIVGRYAYTIYDTSGLLDANVAGYPSSALTNAANKGLLPWADLTQLGIPQPAIDKMVAWRNAASSATYATSVYSAATNNGFIAVTNGDTCFLNRQELIKYAQTQNLPLTNALPYLTTFSRELNGPTWGPSTPTGSTTNYAQQQFTHFILNPRIPNPRVQTAFKRNNGLMAVVGEPLVKYRFPLDKLALLEKFTGTGQGTLTAADVADIQKYFGLDLAADANGPSYRHWNYPTASRGGNDTIGNILTLDEVAALNPGREPDFFELLQAGMLSGSLGVPGKTAAGNNAGRGDQWPANQNGLGSATTYIDTDDNLTIQVMRIGANIIDQWDADSFPTTITDTLAPFNVYGIEDLPYPLAAFVNLYSAAGVPPFYTYLYFELWNPHQLTAGAANAANYPSSFQLAPFYDSVNPNASDYIKMGLSGVPHNGATKTGVYFYDGSTNFSANLADTCLGNPANLTYGPTNQVFTTTLSGSTSYREPYLVPGTTKLPGSTSTAAPAPFNNLACFTAHPITTWPGPSAAPNDPANNATNPKWSASFTNSINYSWDIKLYVMADMLLQYRDAGGTYRTYSTFTGMDSVPGATYPYVYGTGYYIQGIPAPTSVLSTNAMAAIKSDPRTFRLGPGLDYGTSYNNANQPVATSPSVVNIPVTTSPPFGAAVSPYRIDMWAVNDGTGAPNYADIDGVTRWGDARNSYRSQTTSPIYPGSMANRPVVLNRPFQSVGELGYVYRDAPWKTLDFASANSADSGLLDLFTLSDAPVVAGRVNPNTPYPQVLAALLSGATQSTTNATTISAGNALALGQALQGVTSNTPFINRADLVANFMTNTEVASITPTGIKTEEEAVVRGIAESANTRTWNFMIDIIAQTGRYPTTAHSLDNFVVEGERRYWLHIAIDRYTGQVVDKQLEVVNE